MISKGCMSIAVTIPRVSVGVVIIRWCCVFALVVLKFTFGEADKFDCKSNFYHSNQHSSHFNPHQLLNIEHIIAIIHQIFLHYHFHHHTTPNPPHTHYINSRLLCGETERLQSDSDRRALSPDYEEIGAGHQLNRGPDSGEVR